MNSSLKDMLKRLLPYFLVEKMYIKYGIKFANSMGYIYLGERTGLEKFLNKWASWEEEYASRGYQTLSLDSFIEH